MDPITIMALAAGALKLGEDLYTYIAKLRATAQQSGEWTEAQEEAFLALQAQRAGQPWQQPQG